MAIKNRYFWKGSYSDVLHFITNCDVCQRKENLKKAKKPLQPIPVPGSPFKQVGMDLIGPLVTTKKGKKMYLQQLFIKNVYRGQEKELDNIFMNLGLSLPVIFFFFFSVVLNGASTLDRSYSAS